MLNRISDFTSANDHQIHTSAHPEKSVSDENHVTKKQGVANSCGAASLLCAAIELGVNKMPVFKGSLSDITGNDALELNNICESDLYQLTCSNHNPLTHSSDISQAGYSMPENIVTAARICGLNTHVVEDNIFFSKALSFIYPHVKEVLNGIGCEIRHADIPLNLNQRKLEAVAVSFAGIPVGLHWVLCRPDGSYMDPGTGKNSPDFAGAEIEMKQYNSKFCGYYKTGISVILTSPEKMPA
ncbi:MAG: hypothetical protein RR510_17245 [Morganella sp. (in: enterobacteria)]